MKHLNKIFTLLVLVAATISFTGCDKGDDNKKSEKQQQIDKLVGTWKAQSVTYTSDVTADYQNFTLEIKDAGNETMTYTATGRPSGKLTPWPASGALSLGSNIQTKLNRADGITIDYTVNANTLTMDFAYSGAGETGKTNSVEGPWKFTFNK